MPQDSCGALIKQINDELEKQANNSLRADDLTMAQMGVLLALDWTGGKQMTCWEPFLLQIPMQGGILSL